MKAFYTFAWWVTRVLFAILYDIRIEGRENIPAKGGALVVSNHRFLKDPVVLAHAFPPRRQLHFMSKAEWFDNKAFGLLLSALGVFPVNRGQGDMTAINRAEELVSGGHLVGIFPEGTRNRTGGPMKPKSGAAFIARQAHADILPCALLFGERRGFRSRITVKIGQLIPYEELGFQSEERVSLRRASKLIMNRINALLGWEEDGNEAAGG